MNQNARWAGPQSTGAWSLEPGAGAGATGLSRRLIINLRRN